MQKLFHIETSTSHQDNLCAFEWPRALDNLAIVCASRDCDQCISVSRMMIHLLIMVSFLDELKRLFYEIF